MQPSLFSDRYFVYSHSAIVIIASEDILAETKIPSTIVLMAHNFLSFALQLFHIKVLLWVKNSVCDVGLFGWHITGCYSVCSSVKVNWRWIGLGWQRNWRTCIFHPDCILWWNVCQCMLCSLVLEPHIFLLTTTQVSHFF